MIPIAKEEATRPNSERDAMNTTEVGKILSERFFMSLITINLRNFYLSKYHK